MAKPWTPREDALLRHTASMQARTGYASGGRPRRGWPDTWRYTTLARRLGRSYGAVRMRALRLGVHVRT